MTHIISHPTVWRMFFLHSWYSNEFFFLPSENIEGGSYSASNFTQRGNPSAKYDSSNKIQIPGYLVDLFSKGDSPRKYYQLGKDDSGTGLCQFLT